MNPFPSYLLAAAALCGLLSLPAAAQNYPNKPIRIVIPTAAGGAIDTIIQQVGPRLTEAWGQPIVMDHRPGATQMIGTQYAAKAAPDGYTLVTCNSTPFSNNLALFPNVPYDPVKDFAAITPAVTYPNVLVVHPSLQINTLAELIALAKTKPGSINYASAGTASSSHISGELLNLMAGVKLVHVPYKGNSLAVNDLLGGQVQIMFSNIGPALPFLKTGRLKALGVTSPKRSAALPDVPTLAEAGLPGFEIIPWVGFCAPAGTPKDIVTKLNTEIVRILKLPDVQAVLQAQGADITTMSPAEMDVYIKRDMAKWAQIIKAANIKAN
ncbi:MAG: tripartite tricarboxylate transporter substrate binding protein [Burkholderiaceae bacterium]|nr:tripartite tricarboxylate transporter substrate binding protein [Burkholderiaceae bacterium]